MPISSWVLLCVRVFFQRALELLDTPASPYFVACVMEMLIYTMHVMQMLEAIQGGVLFQ